MIVIEQSIYVDQKRGKISVCWPERERKRSVCGTENGLRLLLGRII